MKYRTNILKSMRKSFKSSKEFEDETTSHKRGLMLCANATCDIQ